MAKTYCTTFQDIKSAYQTIKPYINKTPLLQCSFINEKCSKNIFLKCENLQKTGSFKLRGALNAVKCSLKKGGNPGCVVTHSSGNHGQAVALAAKLCKLEAFIVMPDTAPKAKRSAVIGYGGNVVDCLSTEKSREETADKVQKEKRGLFVHASQNPHVIAGQGTVGLEILEDNPSIDAIVVAVGGGGLISGIALAAKTINPNIKIYAAEPEEACSCFRSVKSGTRTINPKTPVTIADGVKVSIGENTWPVISDLVDDVITVSEDEIKEATKAVYEKAKLVVEPTAGVAVAAVMKNNFNYLKGNDSSVKNVAVILCGGNCDIESVVSFFN